MKSLRGRKGLLGKFIYWVTPVEVYKRKLLKLLESKNLLNMGYLNQTAYRAKNLAMLDQKEQIAHYLSELPAGDPSYGEIRKLHRLIYLHLELLMELAPLEEKTQQAHHVLRMTYKEVSYCLEVSPLTDYLEELRQKVAKSMDSK